MSKFVVYMVVKDDDFYIDMAIKSAIDHAEIFILDTGSTDSTISIINSFQNKYPNKIHLHQEEFGSNDYLDGEFRFAKEFRQADAVNFALKSAIDLCKPEGFVICLDADEVLNDRFWEILEKCDADALAHSTSLPITPFKVSNHPLDMHDWRGFHLFDPHIRAWKANIPAKWVQKDEISNIHLLVVYGKSLDVQVTPDTVHFHLHYSMGPKSIYSYIVKVEQVVEEAAKILRVPLPEMHNQKYFMEHFPGWFKDGRFIPKNIEDHLGWNKHVRFSVPMSHPMPHYVVEKWLDWGNPIEN